MEGISKEAGQFPESSLIIRAGGDNYVEIIQP